MTKESIALGQVLRRIRKERKMSQDDVCGKATMDQSFLSEIENGHRQPRVGMLFRIARALETSPSAILIEVEEILRKQG